MFASVYSIAESSNVSLADTADVTFTATSSLANATLTGGNTTIQLAGDATTARFLVSWGVRGVSTGSSGACTLGVTIDGVSQSALSFRTTQGATRNNGGGEVILAIPQNAALTLRNQSGQPCFFVNGTTLPGAFFNVLKIE